MEPIADFDKNSFRKVIKMIGIKIPVKLISNYLKEFRDMTLNIEKLPAIAKDYVDSENRKLLLLDPKFKKEEQESWPKKLTSCLFENEFEMIDYEIVQGYDDMTL